MVGREEKKYNAWNDWGRKGEKNSGINHAWKTDSNSDSSHSALPKRILATSRFPTLELIWIQAEGKN